MTYDYTPDLRVENNSHTQLVRRVPRGAKVLELGCATGYLSAVLVGELGCEVTGVELDPGMAERAADHCQRVIRADVEDLAWLEEVRDQRFDVILLADILEHLRAPQALLSALSGHLTDTGMVLASIPNAVHGAIRLEMLEGRLTYEDDGLLDRTHLHFYTYASVRALFEHAGYRIGELSYTFHDLPDEIIRARLDRLGLTPSDRTLNIFHSPEAVAYQYIVTACPLRDGEVREPYRELHDLPFKESLEFHRNLVTELQALGYEAQKRGMAVDELQQAVKDRDGRLAELQQRLTLVQEKLQRRAIAQHEERRALANRLEQQAARNRQLAVQLKQTQSSLKQTRARLKGANEQLAAHSRTLTALLNSRGWRYWRNLTLPVRAWRRLRPNLLFVLRHPGKCPQCIRQGYLLFREGGLPALKQRLSEPGKGLSNPIDPGYQEWIRRRESLDGAQQQAIRGEIAGWSGAPRISILMPVFNVEERWLRGALDSVLHQSYPNWELCIADDASTMPHVRRVLEEYAGRDGRIRVDFRTTNGHIVAATNTALGLATGDFIGLMDHDDLLAPHALYYVAKEIMNHPDAGLIYSDEDKIDAQGRRFAHYFKPDYNPDLMLSHNMICHFGVYRTSLVRELGGFRDDFLGAQDYDLALRVISRLDAGQVRHISKVLYHWRAIPQSTASGGEAKPYAVAAAIQTIRAHLASRGVEADVGESPLITGMFRVRYHLPESPPLVSIIIPTRNGYQILAKCIDSILERTEYKPYEIIVVDNQSDDTQTLEYLQQLETDSVARVLKYDKPFNYSAINNFAVAHADGGVICLLNNDIEVICKDWLGEMVSQALRPEIGAVGARLWYSDNRLQHGGVVLGLGGVAGHAMKYLPRGGKGYNARAVLVQNYSAVTAACLVLRKTVFDQAGGFDEENLPVAFNDVDFCLRIQEQGYRNLWTPHAELYHHESASRGPEDTSEKQQRFRKEIMYMQQRWGDRLEKDPAYNPNLTSCREDFSLG